MAKPVLILSQIEMTSLDMYPRSADELFRDGRF